MGALRLKGRIVDWRRRISGGASPVRGGKSALRPDRSRLVRKVTASLVAVLSVWLAATGSASAHSDVCHPIHGCVVREYGTRARWWADSAVKGRCAGQSDQDWIVSYKVDNSTWRSANPDSIRFYAADWSKVSWGWPWGSPKAATTDPYPPGVKLCFGGTRYTKNDVMGTWIWLKQ